jgi:hypothetical protein
MMPVPGSRRWELYVERKRITLSSAYRIEGMATVRNIAKLPISAIPMCRRLTDTTGSSADTVRVSILSAR